MKRIFFALGVFLMLIIFAPRVSAAGIAAGDLIKASQPAVYYYGANGKRYVFPNEKTYKTWYADFSGVKTITDAELAAIQIGGNITYKPGVKLVKITTDPKVYAISKGENLRWIKTENLAISLYGADWNKQVEDIPDAFFTNYLVGSPLASPADYSVSAELAATTDINSDKSISAPAAAASPSPCSGVSYGCYPPAPAPTSTPVAYQWNIKTINDEAHSHQNLAFGNYQNGFVASWNDDRNSQNEVYYEAADLTAAGSGAAVRVSNNVTDSTNGKNAFDGTNLYILWEDSSPLKRAIYMQNNDLYGNRVRLSVFASTTYATSKYPDIVWNGLLGEYGVVWWDTKTSLNGAVGDTYFSLIKNGLKSGNELLLSAAPSPDFKPRVIAANNNFAAVWQEGDMSIRVALVDGNSALVDNVKKIYTASEAVEPRIAWNGNGFGAVWAENVGGVKDIYFMQLDSAGNKVGNKIALTSGAGDAAEPTILWGGDKFYVAYTNYKPNAAGYASDVRLMKVNTDGTIAAVATSISTAGITAHLPNLAKSGSVIGAAWLENNGSTDKIMGAVETQK